jgi:thioredoxin-related protein
MRKLAFAAAALLAAGLALPTLARDDKAAKTDKPGVKKPVYDEKADTKADIAAALAAAKRENRRVLIQWGGNWCSWCLLLHERFKSDRNLAKTLLYEYDVVYVDIGKSDKNLDLAAKYGADFKKHGVPYLTVLDAEGKALANQQTDVFETKSEDGKNGHDPRKLQEFLTANQAAPLKADEVLTAALAEAAKTERVVFLHFGAPWCSWCKKLDAWLLRPNVAGIIGKDFIDVKIDNDRMAGAKEVFNRYNANARGGIPWFVFLDGKGKGIINSDGPKGNIGYPAEPHEIEYFVSMLKAAKRRLTDMDIEELRKSLTPPAKATAPNQ